MEWAAKITVKRVPKMMMQVAIIFCRVSFSELKRGAISRFQTSDRAPNGARRDWGAMPKATKSRREPDVMRESPITHKGCLIVGRREASGFNAAGCRAGGGVT